MPVSAISRLVLGSGEAEVAETDRCSCSTWRIAVAAPTPSSTGIDMSSRTTLENQRTTSAITEAVVKLRELTRKPST